MARASQTCTPAPLFSRHIWPLIALAAALGFLGGCPAKEDTAGKAPNAADAGQDTSSTDQDAASTGPGACEALADGNPVWQTHALANGWQVRARAADGAWEVLAPGQSEPVLSGPGACDGAPALEVGTGQASVKNLFGAFQIGLRGPQVPIAWQAATEPTPRIDASAEAVRLRWPLAEGQTLTLAFLPSGEQNLAVRLETDLADAVVGSLSAHCQPGEEFFGLGAQSVGMALRGRQYPLWTQEQGNGKPEGGGTFPLNQPPEVSYAPMGVWHSSEGYAAVVERDSYAELDLCREDTTRLVLRSHLDMPAVVLIAGDSPAERLSRVGEILGRPSMPAPWVFGPWNDVVGGPGRLWHLAHLLREEGIPSSAIWAEDWIGGTLTPNGFRLSYAWAWDPATYPELARDIEVLHDRGFAFLAYFNPFVPNTVPMWAEGVAQGHLIQKADGTPYTFLDPAFRTASLVDLTSPGARDWVKGYMRRAVGELGIDGWMLDFAEWLPVDAKLGSGENAWQVHNRYPLLWQQTAREVFEELRPQGEEGHDQWAFFARSGWASTQGATAPLAPILWGGDQNTDWGYDDGMPTVVPLGAHLGLAGVSLFGPDIAGYASIANAPADKELFLRWSALGAMQPVMRTHHGSKKCENWTLEGDPETLAHYRRHAVVHTLLFPYFWERAREAHQSSLPVVRHPWLVEPGIPQLWQGTAYQYFLGPDILVAPVLEKGASARPVVVPPGQWWPMLGTAPLEGAGAEVREVRLEVPVTEIGALVRPGTVLPLLWDPVDSFYGGTRAPGVTRLEDVEGRYRLALYPDASGGLVPTDVQGTQVQGERLVGEALDAMASWQGTRVNGADVASCTSAQSQPAGCVDGEWLVVEGLEIVVELPDGGRIALASPNARAFRLGLAGRAFGAWREATPVTSLVGGAPAHCGTSRERGE